MSCSTLTLCDIFMLAAYCLFVISCVRSLRRGVEAASIASEEGKLLFGPRVNGSDDGGESRTKNQANPAQVSPIITYDANTVGLKT